MRCTLPDRMTPGQMGRGLGMAHHYHTPGTGTKGPPLAGGPPPSQAVLEKTQTTGTPPGETDRLPESDRTAQANTKRQVRSKGTPHVGHANCLMNDEHGSRSDISDWSPSNPVTRAIKVTLPTPTISLYNHSYIHTRIHSIHPRPPDDSTPNRPGAQELKHRTCSEMHHNAP